MKKIHNLYVAVFLTFSIHDLAVCAGKFIKVLREMSNLNWGQPPC